MIKIIISSLSLLTLFFIFYYGFYKKEDLSQLPQSTGQETSNTISGSANPLNKHMLAQRALRKTNLEKAKEPYGLILEENLADLDARYGIASVYAPGAEYKKASESFHYAPLIDQNILTKALSDPKLTDLHSHESFQMLLRMYDIESPVMYPGTVFWKAKSNTYQEYEVNKATSRNHSHLLRGEKI